MLNSISIVVINEYVKRTEVVAAAANSGYIESLMRMVLYIRKLQIYIILRVSKHFLYPTLQL